MILTIILLAEVVLKLNTKVTLLYTIAFIWTACVMLARIIAGAHFLSDVSVGADLTKKDRDGYGERFRRKDYNGVRWQYWQ